jgi:hypothetical protein
MPAGAALGASAGESESMAYKGMDLNLRSSQAWPAREPAGIEESGANGGWSHPARSSSEPIAVDDTVLASCNGAYDAAQFHGAAEVRLEHLLHAMTRVKPAVDLMEQLGIRTGQLRQETAVAIASEAPADAEGKSSTAGEVEEVLRRAAGLAAERKAPAASVADLLRVLLGLGRKAPAMALLMRSAADTSALERWRDEARRELPPTTQADAEARARPNLADALFKRLDSMEGALRALQADVAAERRAMMDALAHRAETAPAAGAAQVQAVATALEKKLDGAVASLGERLSAIDKLTTSESWAYMGARIDVIEKQIGRQSKEVADAVSNVLLEHLIKTEESQGGQEGEARSSGAGIERLAALETGIEAQLQRADEAARTHEHSLAEIYEALVKLGTNQQTLASNLNTWRVESSGDVSIISNRLEQMERTAQETLGRLDGQVQSLRQTVGGSSERRGWMGFKRWLYGTTSVLSGAWRDDADAARQRLRPASVPVKEASSGPKPAPAVATVTITPAEEKKAEA